MIFTDRLGQQVAVDLPAVEAELHTLVQAADAACAISSTATELESLRRARSRFMDALERAKRSEPATE